MHLILPEFAFRFSLQMLCIYGRDEEGYGQDEDGCGRGEEGGRDAEGRRWNPDLYLFPRIRVFILKLMHISN